MSPERQERFVEELQRAGRLADAEFELRSRARVVELDPNRTAEARRLYRRASAARRARHAVLRRWSLI